MRGYMLQGVYCLLEMLEVSDWSFIQLEPNEQSDKIDILRVHGERKIATQIKSSRNSIENHDVKAWVKELVNSISADEYELILLGPCSRGATKVASLQKPPIRVKILPLNIEELLDASAHKVALYLECHQRNAGTAQKRKCLVEGLTTRITSYTIEGQPIARAEFERWLFEETAEVTAQSTVFVPVSSCSSQTILDETLSRMYQNVNDDRYEQLAFPGDCETVERCLRAGAAPRRDSLDDLAVWTGVCPGCARGMDRYLLLRNSIRIMSNEMLSALTPCNGIVKILYTAANGEFCSGDKEESLRYCALADQIPIEPDCRGASDTMNAKVSAKSCHDDHDLVFSNARLGFRRARHEENSYEIVQAKKCLACRAVGLRSPKANELIDDYWSSLHRLPEGPNRNYLYRDALVIKIANHLPGLDLNDKTSWTRSPLIELSTKVLSFDVPVRYSLSKVNRLLTSFLLGTATSNSQLLASAGAIMPTIRKRFHCLFDLEQLVSTMAKERIGAMPTPFGER